MNKSGVVRPLIYFSFLLLIIIGDKTYAAENGAVTDTTLVEVRQPDKEFFDSYRVDDAFIYEQEVIAGGNLFWRNLWEYIKKFIYRSKELYSVIPILLKIGIIGLVLFLAFLAISKTKIHRIFYSEKDIKIPMIEVSEKEEMVEDIDEAIHTEEVKKQYRKAIRIHYLKVLEKLDSFHIINYSKEKTNYDYIRELGTSILKTDFNSLTNSYNHIWYGQIDISEKKYHELAINFEKFNVKLSAEDK